MRAEGGDGPCGARVLDILVRGDLQQHLPPFLPELHRGPQAHFVVGVVAGRAESLAGLGTVRVLAGRREQVGEPDGGERIRPDVLSESGRGVVGKNEAPSGGQDRAERIGDALAEAGAEPTSSARKAPSDTLTRTLSGSSLGPG